MTGKQSAGPQTVLVHPNAKHLPVHESHLLSGAYLNQLIRQVTGAERVSPETNRYLRRHVEDMCRALLEETARVFEAEQEARSCQGKKHHGKPALSQRHVEAGMKQFLERLKTHPILQGQWLTAP